MIGPCSTIFADIVVDDLGTTCLDKLDSVPVTYFRYVDIIFAIILKDKLSQMVDFLNSYNNKLRFTYKMEINN